MFDVLFETNIDFYHGREFPRQLPFRPELKDRVPFNGQETYFPKYPFLTITRINYRTDDRGNFDRFECYLDFGDAVHPDIAKKILNHKTL